MLLCVASPTTWTHGEVPAQAATEGQPGSMAMQQQGSALMSIVVIVPPENMGMSLLRAAAEDYLDVKWSWTVQNWPHPTLDVILWRGGPISHLQQLSGEWPCAPPRQHRGAGPGGRGASELSWPTGHKLRRASLSTPLL